MPEIDENDDVGAELARERHRLSQIFLSAACRDYNLKSCMSMSVKHKQPKGCESDRVWQYRIERRYGLDRATLLRMLERQNGVCAICHQLCAHKKRLNVDHDHRTGKVRGLLCWNCNTSLGKFQDNPALLYEAARYLERGGCH